MTFHWRGTASSVSVTSSPIFDSFAEPQHAQDVGRRHHHALARQVRRERLASRPAPGEPLDLRGLRRRLPGRQLVLRRARLELVELEFQLVEKPLLALRARARYISRRSFSMVSLRKAISASASDAFDAATAARASASVAFASALDALTSAAARAAFRAAMLVPLSIGGIESQHPIRRYNNLGG